MDPWFSKLSGTVNEVGCDDISFFSSYEQSQYLKNGSKDGHIELDPLYIPLPSISPGIDNFAPSSTASDETDSPDDLDSDPVLKFLNQILVEEDLEEKPSMFHDPLALRATEKSLYDVIGQKYPPSPSYPGSYGFDNPSEHISSSNSGNSSIDPHWTVDPGENILFVKQGHLQDMLSNSFLPASSQSPFNAVNISYGNGNTQMNHFGNPSLIQNLFTDSESILQFQRGMEEASKFLPTSNQLVIDLDQYELPQKSESISTVVVNKEKKEESHAFPNGLKGRKHKYSDDGDLEDMERSSKQFAANIEEVELSEMFDRVLLQTDDKECCGNDSQLPSSPLLPNGKRNNTKKNEAQVDSVDLWSLLISCAQSVAADDRRTAYEHLRKIMQHSSPTGDVDQRLAHVFGSGLQARLCGTGTELYASLTRRKITAAEKLKALQVYLKACPFKKLPISFSNQMIASVAAEATSLHIIDFGINYGFQWPILIQHLSKRVGGPLKLRITGIELPQPGLRPAERVEETGCRLAKYCERFGVPFEYQAIAQQNWEAIQIKDLKITSGEVLAVNSLFQFDRLLDETVTVDSPRDAVLNLIRKIKPDIFISTVTNGFFSAPFFVTRFREALFHYSTLFDMFDATLSRDNPSRIDFEQDFFGREVINVVACEGGQRVERPETYRQWQVRHMRAGFKPLPLGDGIMKKYRQKGAAYHKDFLYDEDGCWFLQGWKGRIICASSCWVPAWK